MGFIQVRDNMQEQLQRVKVVLKKKRGTAPSYDDCLIEMFAMINKKYPAFAKAVETVSAKEIEEISQK